jgi:hypothetical protein
MLENREMRRWEKIGPGIGISDDCEKHVQKSDTAIRKKEERI